MRLIPLMVLCLAASTCGAGGGVPAPVTNIAELVSLSDADFAARRPFDFVGRLVHFGTCIPEPGDSQPRYSIWLRDAEHVQLVHGPLPSEARIGCSLRVIGTTEFNPSQFRVCIVSRTSISDRTIPPHQAIDLSGSDLTGDRFNQRLVRVEGLVDEVFADEVDPIFTFLVIRNTPATSRGRADPTSRRSRQCSKLSVSTLLHVFGKYGIILAHLTARFCLSGARPRLARAGVLASKTK